MSVLGVYEPGHPRSLRWFEICPVGPTRCDGYFRRVLFGRACRLSRERGSLATI